MLNYVLLGNTLVVSGESNTLHCLTDLNNMINRFESRIDTIEVYSSDEALKSCLNIWSPHIKIEYKLGENNATIF